MRFYEEFLHLTIHALSECTGNKVWPIELNLIAKMLNK